MEDQEPTSFTFEIDNFSEKETRILSPNFSSGGCEWFVAVYPKGNGVDDHLSLSLCVANPHSLRLGWKIRADYSIFVLNQSGKELSGVSEVNELFCAQSSGWGWPKAVPLKKLQKKGILENNKLIVETEVKVVEVVDEGDNFTFEIDNFSEKETLILSPAFSSGGCEWFVQVHPKGECDDHLSLYLAVANSESLPLGWKRRADYTILLLNQSGKEHFTVSGVNQMFCAQFSSWGNPKAVHLEKLQEKGFLENNKLIVKAEVNVVEVVDEGDVTGNEVYDVSGFQVLYTQVISVTRLFLDHPDIALNVRSKNQVVKTTYMNILIGLIATLDKPAHSITETELQNAQSKLMELTEAGFELDWLKKKIDEITLEGKKEITVDSRVRQLEQHVKNLKTEIDNEKVKSTTSDAKVLSLEEEVLDLKTKLNMNKNKKWFGTGTGTEI